MSVSEEAAAAFLESHNRLKSLEETMQGSLESGLSGVLTRLALNEQLVNTSGTLSEGRETQSANIAGSKGCDDTPIFGGEYEEYEDWQYNVRIFLISECSLFARFLAFLERLDHEIDSEDVEDYATSEDFPGRTADVTWMNRQLFNVLAQKTRRNPSRQGKTCQRKKGVAVLELGSYSCMLTRARMRHRASP